MNSTQEELVVNKLYEKMKLNDDDRAYNTWLRLLEFVGNIRKIKLLIGSHVKKGMDEALYKRMTTSTTELEEFASETKGGYNAANEATKKKILKKIVSKIGVPVVFNLVVRDSRKIKQYMRQKGAKCAVQKYAGSGITDPLIPYMNRDVRKLGTSIKFR